MRAAGGSSAGSSGAAPAGDSTGPVVTTAAASTTACTERRRLTTVRLWHTVSWALTTPGAAITLWPPSNPEPEGGRREPLPLRDRRSDAARVAPADRRARRGHRRAPPGPRRGRPRQPARRP